MTSTSANATETGTWQLALSLLIGPLSWSIFFLVGYLIAEAACVTGSLDSNVAGLNLVVVVVVALGLLAAAIAGWGAWWSHRRWRSSGEESDETEALQPFLARASTLLNLLFLVATITTAVGMFFILPCQWT